MNRLAPWTTVEETTLRLHYPVDGPRKCVELLPKRNLYSIYAKARLLGLRAPKVPPTAGKRFATKYPPNDAVDTAIREGYAACKGRGDVAKIAARVGRPRWWVSKRAAELGIAKPPLRQPPWSTEELAILEACGHMSVTHIAKKLRDAGFSRTPSAVGNALKRNHIDRTDPDTWSARELGGLLGVTGKTVVDWIERRSLPASRAGTRRSEDQGDIWVIKRNGLRRWLASNPGFVDLRKVDQVWFMDLAFGG
ncbi:hypothetical protein AAW51_2070 [Caldimonas brevitalea]|uniref:Uncharacterized protein n=2 Tax=Caldimonas brevitalea TaxID=413882 RepID=A0A0G3BN42_9BURK|nr:hypothetical protein AAW51_2070 [Caldimonas brevitalea]